MIPAWAVAAIGLLVAAGIAFAIKRPGKKKRIIKLNGAGKQRLKPEARKKAQGRPDKNPPAGYEEGRRDNLSACFWSYNKALEKISIPENAITAQKCACVFSLEYIPLSHYVWRGEDKLCFFPKWSDISLCIQDPSYIPVADGSGRGTVSVWAIPMDYIMYYVLDEIYNTATVYYGDGGRRYKIVFLEGGDKVCKSLFPEKEYSLVRRREYLGSYGNIQEMNVKMSELQTKKERGLISDREYEFQKEYIVRTL